MSVACNECEKATPIWRCSDCQQSLCGTCDATLHAKGARKSHKRVPFAQPTLKAFMPDVVQVKVGVPTKPATVDEARKLPQTRVADRTSAYLVEDPERDQKSQLAALDSMFKDLKTDMDHVGSKEEVLKVCPSCTKPLAKDEDYIGALGRRFHAACFRCAHCQRLFGDQPFVEHDGKVYCPPDHKLLFSSKCYVCGATVKDKIVKALGRVYHEEHFTCTHCKKPLPTNYVEKDGQLYCPQDYTQLFAQKCHLCTKPINGPFISTDGKQIHAECFACQVCHKPLMNQKAFSLNGRPHCELHFHEANNTLCAKCRTPVVGQVITAFSRTYHPQCFACTTCGKVLTGSYFQRNNQPQCEDHQ